jgi:DUF3014 family protein
MDDLSEYRLQRTEPDDLLVAPRHGRPLGLWTMVVLLAAAGGVAVYVALGGWFSSTQRPATAAPTARDRELPPRSLGGESDASRLPPLDESDPLVRQLVRAISQNPVVAAWLATNGLVRNFTVVVVNIAEGASPAKHLAPLRPTGGFTAAEHNGQISLDPRSYRRYDGLANAVASIDPAGAARIYTMLKPRIEEAYRELGFPDRSFDGAFERAVVSLLRTPIVDRPVRLTPKGIGYAFVDERLESLTSAQKQLLRFGPENQRTIQEKLRAIAIALGIPAASLPGD